MENEKFYVNTANTNTTHNVCIDDLLTVSRTMHDQFIDMFSCIPLRVDTKLKGMSWNIAVSQKLYEEILAKEKAKQDEIDMLNGDMIEAFEQTLKRVINERVLSSNICKT